MMRPTLTGLAALCFMSMGCVTGTTVIEPGEPDRQLLERQRAGFPAEARLPVPAIARFVNFPSTLSVKPKGLDLFAIKFGGIGHVFECPVDRAVREAMSDAVAGSFQPADERPKPIGSDNLDVEFLLIRAEILHGGGSGRVRCNMKVTCIVRLPSDYKVATFKFDVSDTGQHPPGGSPNALWKTAAVLALECYQEFQEPGFKASVNRYRSEEWVCQKTGHKMGLADSGRFCTIHATQFVKRIALCK